MSGWRRVQPVWARQRHADLGHRDAGHLVAVLVHRRDERAEARPLARRRLAHHAQLGVGAEVEPARPRVVAREVRRRGSALEGLGQRLRRHRGAVVEARMAARRRLDRPRSPRRRGAPGRRGAGGRSSTVPRRFCERSIQPDGSAAIGVRVGRAATRRGRARCRRSGRRACAGRGDVAQPVGIGVDQRGIAAMVLGRGVRVEDLEPAAAGVEAPVERVGRVRHRVGRRRRRSRGRRGPSSGAGPWSSGRSAG